MLKNSISGVDLKPLQKAILTGLQNEDGRARGQISHVYEHLTLEQIKPLLPAIVQAIEQPSPSGEMFAEGIRIAGLKLLAKHHVKEGMSACVDYILAQNPWASEHRTPEILAILESYGANAQATIPQLRKTAAKLDKGEINFPLAYSKQKAQNVRDAILRIEQSTRREPMISIR
jgi:hypothetical protein